MNRYFVFIHLQFYFCNFFLTGGDFNFDWLFFIKLIWWNRTHPIFQNLIKLTWSNKNASNFAVYIMKFIWLNKFDQINLTRWRCSENMQQIYRRKPKPKCDFTLRHGCSPVNLQLIFRTTFSKNTSEWLLLWLEIRGEAVRFSFSKIRYEIWIWKFYHWITLPVEGFTLIHDFLFYFNCGVWWLKFQV